MVRLTDRPYMTKILLLRRKTPTQTNKHLVFSLLEPKAHFLLSVCLPHSLNISETTGPIEAKFHMESPWEGGDESLFKRSWSHDQDSRHAHI